MLHCVYIKSSTLHFKNCQWQELAHCISRTINGSKQEHVNQPRAGAIGNWQLARVHIHTYAKVGEKPTGKLFRFVLFRFVLWMRACSVCPVDPGKF